MVMAERSCWRSGTDKRGWAVRSGTARGELAVSDTAEPTAEAWAFAGGQTTSIAAGIPTVLRSGCFRGLIAYSFLFIPSLSRSLYATDLFTRSESRGNLPALSLDGIAAKRAHGCVHTNPPSP